MGFTVIQLIAEGYFGLYLGRENVGSDKCCRKSAYGTHTGNMDGKSTGLVHKTRGYVLKVKREGVSRTWPKPQGFTHTFP